VAKSRQPSNTDVESYPWLNAAAREVNTVWNCWCNLPASIPLTVTVGTRAADGEALAFTGGAWA
jgi:hypothetical protein